MVQGELRQLYRVYHEKICNREEGDDSCPYCHDRKVLAGFNSLDVTKNELLPEWSPNNERSMSDFFSSSAYRALWICPACNGEYTEKIYNREFGDDSCPYCHDRKVLAGFNSLDVTKKELIPEWSQNNERPMYDFFSSSAYSALWICPTCNGEYSEKIYNREFGDDSCPYCHNRKLLPGFNSFNVRHDDLLQEWDYINNYLIVDPNTILDTFNDDVWWNCKKHNQTYKYQMSPKRKVYLQKRHMQSCPLCKGRRRKKLHYQYV